MKQLEHVLKRVRVDGDPLTERQYAVARAVAERTVDADRGAQLAITQIMAGSFKQRSTVKTALRELVSIGVIRRSRPAGDARHATHIFRFSQLLIDQAEKSRPYLGPDLEFHTAQIAEAKTRDKNAIFCGEKSLGTRMNPHKYSIADGQLSAGQELTGNCKVFHTPPPLPSPLPPTFGACFPHPVFPCAPLQGGGGVCSGALKESDFEDFGLFQFFEFLTQRGANQIEVAFQRRKKDGTRGGTFGRRMAGNLDELRESVGWAASQKFELTMRARGVLLVDDLDGAGVGLVKQSGLAACVIETSVGNFQSLFVAPRDWSSDRIRGAQKALRARFGGDPGATSAGQLHRLPGSLNQKSGASFVTRLVHTQNGLDALEPTQAELAAADQSKPIDNTSGDSPARGRDESPSGQEFVECLRLYRSGWSVDQVEAQVLSMARARNRPGNQQYYARRTAERARAVFRPRP